MSELTGLYNAPIADPKEARSIASMVSDDQDAFSRNEFLFRFEPAGSRTAFKIRSKSEVIACDVGNRFKYELNVAIDGKEGTDLASAVDWSDKIGLLNGLSFDVISRECIRECLIIGDAAFSFWSLRGELTVTDTSLFINAYQSGIGPLAEYGQGMLVLKQI